MKENHAVEFITLQNSPASALGRVHLVVAVPGPLDCWFAIPCRQAAIHLAVDVAEVELSAILFIEFEISLFFLVNEFLVPGAHRDDTPASSKGVLG